MIERNIIDKIQYLLIKYPVVTITGTRQCGKSTLLRNGFPTMRYVSLEDPDLREFAIDDARGFLNNFGSPLIIDEAQYAPKLFSYIQTRIDSENQTGMYILSGSHNFLLMESISQSLAGRTAILKMAPFSISELTHADLLPELNEWLFTGGFPRIYDKQINPVDFFPSYFQTYIERDVRLLRNINDLSHFVRFVKLCAARIGQLLNINALANECEVSAQTINSWISVLETSYVIYLLKPYHNNFNKRLVKSPKLYFCDTGLAASLLGMENARQMDTHYLRGELFENMVIMEFIKQEYAQGREPNISFWRDSNQNEIDLLVERGLDLQAYEIKSSATMKTDYFKGLNKFAALAQLPKESLHVVYGGDVNYLTSFGDLISWKNIGLSK